MTKKNVLAVIRHEEVMVFGAPILVAVLEGEEKYVSPRHISEAMGLSWASQYNRIKKNKILSDSVFEMKTHGADGVVRPMFMIPLDKMSGWLMSIQINRCNPKVRPALVKYQTEAYAVLDAWFRKNARAATDPTDMMEIMEKAIAKALAPLQVQLEAVVIDNKTMKPKVEAYDSLTEEGQKFLLNNVAREVGVSRKVLADLLIDGGVLEGTYVNGTYRNVATDYAMSSGLTVEYTDGNGRIIGNRNYFFTAKGRSLCERLVYDWKAQQKAA